MGMDLLALASPTSAPALTPLAKGLSALAPDRSTRGGSSPKLSTTSSSSWQMRDTRLFEMPSHPNALTRSSTRLVDTPST